jgi:hypothetical protein
MKHLCDISPVALGVVTKVKKTTHFQNLSSEEPHISKSGEWMEDLTLIRLADSRIELLGCVTDILTP